METSCSHGCLYCASLCITSIPYTFLLLSSGSDEALHNIYGEGTGPIVMDFVNCNGSEVRLWECSHFTHSYSGCDHTHDAGVRCQPGNYYLHLQLPPVANVLYVVECDDGEVRLLQGERIGQVEVCVSNRWLTVCSGWWNAAAASTVCRQLGYYKPTSK